MLGWHQCSTLLAPVLVMHVSFKTRLIHVAITHALVPCFALSTDSWHLWWSVSSRRTKSNKAQAEDRKAHSGSACMHGSRSWDGGGGRKGKP